MEISHLRQAVLEALKAAIPGAFGEEMGRSFLAGELNVELARFGMDSLAGWSSALPSSSPPG